MPTVELLKKYHLMQFAEVTQAVRWGPFLLGDLQGVGGRG